MNGAGCWLWAQEVGLGFGLCGEKEEEREIITFVDFWNFCGGF